MKKRVQWVRTPRQSRSQASLDRMLDATERLLHERSFEQIPVGDIVKEAGTSVGSFYARFEDKSALFQALHERFVAEARATSQAALDPAVWADATLEQIVVALCTFLVDDYRERAGFRRSLLLGSNDPLFRERVGALDRDVCLALGHLFEGRPGLREARPYELANEAYMLLVGALDRCVLYGPAIDASLAASLSEWIERGLCE